MVSQKFFRQNTSKKFTCLCWSWKYVSEIVVSEKSNLKTVYVNKDTDAKIITVCEQWFAAGGEVNFRDYQELILKQSSVGTLKHSSVSNQICFQLSGKKRKINSRGCHFSLSFNRLSVSSWLTRCWWLLWATVKEQGLRHLPVTDLTPFLPSRFTQNLNRKLQISLLPSEMKTSKASGIHHYSGFIYKAKVWSE